MAQPPPHPHDPIEEVFPDVFFVRGGIPMNALLTITRNMAIVRHEGELTLVNPIRLDADGERRLRELGTVRRLLRLGPFHGRDDSYYVDAFRAELWAPGPSRAYPEPKPDVTVDEQTPLPFPGAELFCFRSVKQPECLLRIRREGGILFSCDALQNYGDYRHNNLPARLVMPFIGFPRRTVVGPFWLKLMTPEGASLEGELRRLLERDFAHLVPAHGSLLRGGAHAAVADAVDRAFPR